MATYSATASGTSEEDWAAILRPGVVVDLDVYGDRMTGRLIDAAGGSIRLRVPVAEQTSSLRMSTAHGSAVVSLEGGAVHLPVSCWTAGDVVRLEVIGPIAFRQRRVHPRVPLRVPVTVAWLQDEVGAWKRVVSESVDVSAGGMRVGFARAVWPGAGARVMLVADFTGGAQQTACTVLGVAQDYGLRLRFLDPPVPFVSAVAAVLV